MARPVIIRLHERGPRCWLFGQRVHHGTTGIALVAAALIGVRRPRLRVLGLAGLVLVAHDRADARVWFARDGLDRPSTTE